MLISLSSDSTSQMDLRTIADWTLRPRLLATGGVAQVVVIGGEYKQYQILASPQKMQYYNVSLTELQNACEQANGNSSGGFISEYGNEYIVKGYGRTNDLNDLGKSVIKVSEGKVIKIEDVAEIKIGAAQKIGDGSLKGKPAVIMTVMKQPATNTLLLTEKSTMQLLISKITYHQILQLILKYSDKPTLLRPASVTFKKRYLKAVYL